MEEENLTPEMREAGRAALKAAFGYTDEEVDELIGNSKRRELILHLREIMGKKMVVECVAAENCIYHKVGDKYVFSGPGALIKDESCEQPCLFAMANFAPFCNMLYDRVASGLDPNGMHLDHIQCSDTSLRYGGFGKATFRVYVEDAT